METTESAKPEDKADTAVIEGIDANVIAAITGAAAVAGDIAAEKAASERSQHKVVPVDILPPAKMLYSLVILSALRNHASCCSPLFKLSKCFLGWISWTSLPGF